MSRLPLRALLLGAVVLLAVYVNRGAFGQSAVNSLDGFRACPRQQAECPGSLRAERGLKGGELRVSWERVPTPPLNATTVTVVVDDGEQSVVRQVPAKDTFADFDSLARGRDLEVTAALTRDGHVISETCTLRLRSTQTDTRNPTPRDPPRPPGPFALLPVPNSVAAGYNITYWIQEDATLDHEEHLAGPSHGIHLLDGKDNRSPPTGTHSGVGQVGYRTVCAIRQTDDPDTDGTLNCWSNNFGGTLNDLPDDLGAVTHVSGGAIHMCALLADDTLRCWGNNGRGQSQPPTGAFHTVDSGWLHTCGLRTDGSVVCWGDDRRGQSSVPPALRKARSARAIATGQRHSCAVRADYTVACWGRSDLGQLRVPAGLGPVTALSAGSDHACAIKANGAVACWGDDRYGQVSQVPSGTDWVEISAGYVHTCGRRANGTVECWRIRDAASLPMSSLALIINNSCGIRQADSHLQCWGGLLTFSNIHRWVDGRGVYPVAFKAISHGEANLCGIHTDDTLERWGGLDGSGPNIALPSDLGTVKRVVLDNENTCVVKANDNVQCWGDLPTTRPMPADLGTVKDLVVYGGPTAMPVPSRPTTRSPVGGAPTPWARCPPIWGRSMPWASGRAMPVPPSSGRTSPTGS